jgi:hypothetical protein
MENVVWVNFADLDKYGLESLVLFFNPKDDIEPTLSGWRDRVVVLRIDKIYLDYEVMQLQFRIPLRRFYDSWINF